MTLNFQDVLRDVHNPVTHSLQTSGGGATVFAVVNTGVAGDSTNNIGFATVAVSTPTLYAVVNTTASSGQVTVTLNNTPTVYAVVNTAAAGVANSMVTINPRIDYFGLVSVSGNVAVSSLPATPAGANYIGLVTAVNGLAWPDPKTWIGLATVDIAHAWVDPTTFIGLATTVNGVGTQFIGLVTAFNSNQPALVASSAFIGLVTVANTVTVGAHALTASTVNIGSVSVLGGSIVNSASTNWIGFATVDIYNAWPDPTTFIGLATTVNGAGTQFIGLVTANAVNVGTNKTLVNLPIGFSAASIVTLATPTNANSIKITNMLLNSDATVRFTIKSGVTYLTGNASIGITLNPGGGFIMTGAPDSPSWIGLPSGALVIEKLDLTATSAKIAGNVVYFSE